MRRRGRRVRAPRPKGRSCRVGHVCRRANRECGEHSQGDLDGRGDRSANHLSAPGGYARHQRQIAGHYASNLAFSHILRNLRRNGTPGHHLRARHCP